MITHKLTLWHRAVALAVAVIFTVTSHTNPPVYATATAASSVSSINIPEDLSRIEIPAKLGKVQKVSQGTNGKSVFLIQDAHAIPDAQRNIQNLIGFFQEKYGIDLIALEGASSGLDAQIFRSFPDKEMLESVLNQYADNGELAGSVAAAILNQKESVYYGVEDWELYEAGLIFFLAAMEVEPEILKRLEKISREIAREKEQSYSKPLLEIDRALHDFRSNYMDMLPVLKKLAAFENPQPGTQLAVLLEELVRDKSGQDSLELEVKRIAQAVQDALAQRRGSQEARSDLFNFHEQYQAFQTSRLAPEEFALFLKNLVIKYRIRIKVSTRLDYLVNHQFRMKDIKGTELFDEFDEFSRAVKKRLFRNDRERELDRRGENIYLLKQFAQLELSRDGWNRIKELLSYGERRNGNGTYLTEETKQILDEMKYNRAFYFNAEERDQVFAENLQRLMDERQTSASLMVIGGFHAEGLGKLLEEKGISYVLMMPKIGVIPDENPYRDQMRGEVTWGDYFEIENGTINVYKAFVRATRDRLLNVSRPESFMRNLQPETASLILKRWRDQIIRDLSEKGNIEEARHYTQFIDEMADPSKRIQEFPEWYKRVDEFVEGLERLEAQNQLNQQNVFKLLRPSSIISAAVVPAQNSRLSQDIFANSPKTIADALMASGTPVAATEESSKRDEARETASDVLDIPLPPEENPMMIAPASITDQSSPHAPIIDQSFLHPEDINKASPEEMENGQAPVGHYLSPIPHYLDATLNDFIVEEEGGEKYVYLFRGLENVKKEHVAETAHLSSYAATAVVDLDPASPEYEKAYNEAYQRFGATITDAVLHTVEVFVGGDVTLHTTLSPTFALGSANRLKGGILIVYKIPVLELIGKQRSANGNIGIEDHYPVIARKNTTEDEVAFYFGVPKEYVHVIIDDASQFDPANPLKSIKDAEQQQAEFAARERPESRPATIAGEAMARADEVSHIGSPDFSNRDDLQKSFRDQVTHHVEKAAKTTQNAAGAAEIVIDELHLSPARNQDLRGREDVVQNIAVAKSIVDDLKAAADVNFVRIYSLISNGLEELANELRSESRADTVEQAEATLRAVETETRASPSVLQRIREWMETPLGNFLFHAFRFTAVLVGVLTTANMAVEGVTLGAALVFGLAIAGALSGVITNAPEFGSFQSMLKSKIRQKITENQATQGQDITETKKKDSGRAAIFRFVRSITIYFTMFGAYAPTFGANIGIGFLPGLLSQLFAPGVTGALLVGGFGVALAVFLIGGFFLNKYADILVEDYLSNIKSDTVRRIIIAVSTSLPEFITMAIFMTGAAAAVTTGAPATVLSAAVLASAFNVIMSNVSNAGLAGYFTQRFDSKLGDESAEYEYSRAQTVDAANLLLTTAFFSFFIATGGSFVSLLLGGIFATGFGMPVIQALLSKGEGDSSTINDVIGGGTLSNTMNIAFFGLAFLLANVISPISFAFDPVLSLGLTYLAISTLFLTLPFLVTPFLKGAARESINHFFKRVLTLAGIGNVFALPVILALEKGGVIAAGGFVFSPWIPVGILVTSVIYALGKRVSGVIQGRDEKDTNRFAEVTASLAVEQKDIKEKSILTAEEALARANQYRDGVRDALESGDTARAREILTNAPGKVEGNVVLPAYRELIDITEKLNDLEEAAKLQGLDALRKQFDEIINDYDALIAGLKEQQPKFGRAWPRLYDEQIQVVAKPVGERIGQLDDELMALQQRTNEGKRSHIPADEIVGQNTGVLAGQTERSEMRDVHVNVPYEDSSLDFILDKDMTFQISQLGLSPAEFIADVIDEIETAPELSELKGKLKLLKRYDNRLNREKVVEIFSRYGSESSLGMIFSKNISKHLLMRAVFDSISIKQDPTNVASVFFGEKVRPHYAEVNYFQYYRGKFSDEEIYDAGEAALLAEVFPGNEIGNRIANAPALDENTLARFQAFVEANEDRFSANAKLKAYERLLYARTAQNGWKVDAVLEKRVKELEEQERRVSKMVLDALELKKSDAEKLQTWEEISALDPNNKDAKWWQSRIRTRIQKSEEDAIRRKEIEEKTAHKANASTEDLIQEVKSALKGKDSFYAAVLLSHLAMRDDMTRDQMNTALAFAPFAAENYLDAVTAVRSLRKRHRELLVRKALEDAELSPAEQDRMTQIYLDFFSDNTARRKEALKADASILDLSSESFEEIEAAFQELKTQAQNHVRALNQEILFERKETLIGLRTQPLQEILIALPTRSLRETFQAAKNLNEDELLQIAKTYFEIAHGISLDIPFEEETDLTQRPTGFGSSSAYATLYSKGEIRQLLTRLESLDQWLSKLPAEVVLRSLSLQKLLIVKEMRAYYGHSENLKESKIALALEEKRAERTFYHEMGHSLHGPDGSFDAYISPDRLTNIILKHETELGQTAPGLVEKARGGQISEENSAAATWEVFQALFDLRLKRWLEFNERIGVKNLNAVFKEERTVERMEQEFGNDGVYPYGTPGRASISIEYVFEEPFYDNPGGELTRKEPIELIAEYTQLFVSHPDALAKFEPVGYDLLEAILGEVHSQKMAPAEKALAQAVQSFESDAQSRKGLIDAINNRESRTDRREIQKAFYERADQARQEARQAEADFFESVANDIVCSYCSWTAPDFSENRSLQEQEMERFRRAAEEMRQKGADPEDAAEQVADKYQMRPEQNADLDPSLRAKNANATLRNVSKASSEAEQKNQSWWKQFWDRLHEILFSNTQLKTEAAAAAAATEQPQAAAERQPAKNLDDYFDQRLDEMMKSIRERMREDFGRRKRMTNYATENIKRDGFNVRAARKVGSDQYGTDFYEIILQTGERYFIGVRTQKDDTRKVVLLGFYPFDAEAGQTEINYEILGEEAIDLVNDILSPESRKKIENARDEGSKRPVLLPFLMEVPGFPLQSLENLRNMAYRNFFLQKLLEFLSKLPVEKFRFGGTISVASDNYEGGHFNVGLNGVRVRPNMSERDRIIVIIHELLHAFIYAELTSEEDIDRFIEDFLGEDAPLEMEALKEELFKFKELYGHLNKVLNEMSRSEKFSLVQEIVIRTLDGSDFFKDEALRQELIERLIRHLPRLGEILEAVSREQEAWDQDLPRRLADMDQAPDAATDAASSPVASETPDVPAQAGAMTRDDPLQRFLDGALQELLDQNQANIKKMIKEALQRQKEENIAQNKEDRFYPRGDLSQPAPDLDPDLGIPMEQADFTKLPPGTRVQLVARDQEGREIVYIFEVQEDGKVRVWREGKKGYYLADPNDPAFQALPFLPMNFTRDVPAILPEFNWNEGGLAVAFPELFDVMEIKIFEARENARTEVETDFSKPRSAEEAGPIAQDQPNISDVRNEARNFAEEFVNIIKERGYELSEAEANAFSKGITRFTVHLSGQEIAEIIREARERVFQTESQRPITSITLEQAKVAIEYFTHVLNAELGEGLYAVGIDVPETEVDRLNDALDRGKAQLSRIALVLDRDNRTLAQRASSSAAKNGIHFSVEEVEKLGVRTNAFDNQGIYLVLTHRNQEYLAANPNVLGIHRTGEQEVDPILSATLLIAELTLGGLIGKYVDSISSINQDPSVKSALLKAFFNDTSVFNLDSINANNRVIPTNTDNFARFIQEHQAEMMAAIAA